MKNYFIFFLGLWMLIGSCMSGSKEQESPVQDSLASRYLEISSSTARWLQSVAILDSHGIYWKGTPADSVSEIYNLYHGSSGVLLFFLEMYHATGDIRYLNTAMQAADFLSASVSGPDSRFFPDRRADRDEWAGLYTGISGIGFSLGEAFRITGDEKYKAGMLRCAGALKDSARTDRKGMSLSKVTDLIGGNAGIGLFLLYAYESTRDTSLLNLASRIGSSLIEKSVRDGENIFWEMYPGMERIMPNFSHGTAGISYFLIQLYKSTGDRKFFDAGKRGAEFVRKLAAQNDGLVYHHFRHDSIRGACKGPGCHALDTCMGKQLYYLGWCHGPSGTANLFHAMTEMAGDSVWAGLSYRAMGAVMDHGVPWNLTAGFWNNQGQCCGSAGLGDHALRMYKVHKNQPFLDYCLAIADEIAKHGVADERGLKFPSAENNRQRDVMTMQTGLMHGAAGIGLFYIHLYEYSKSVQPAIRLPDSAF